MFVFHLTFFVRERGRENGSFPAVEVLKPQGFKESRQDGTTGQGSSVG